MSELLSYILSHEDAFRKYGLLFLLPLNSLLSCSDPVSLSKGLVYHHYTPTFLPKNRRIQMATIAM